MTALLHRYQRAIVRVSSSRGTRLQRRLSATLNTCLVTGVADFRFYTALGSDLASAAAAVIAHIAFADDQYARNMHCYLVCNASHRLNITMTPLNLPPQRSPCLQSVCTRDRTKHPCQGPSTHRHPQFPPDRVRLGVQYWRCSEQGWPAPGPALTCRSSCTRVRPVTLGTAPAPGTSPRCWRPSANRTGARPVWPTSSPTRVCLRVCLCVP